MRAYRYYLSPRSRMPEFAGNCAALLCIDTIYTIGSMPHYTQYWDYWVTILASLALSVVCHVLIHRKTELVLFPAAALALVACFSPRLVHWMELLLFFLLLLMMLLRLPAKALTWIRLTGVIAAIVGIFASLSPMFQRIHMLSLRGTATARYLVPYILRTLGGDTMCLLTFLFLLLAFRPYALPGWMDENDQYDRIWE